MPVTIAVAGKGGTGKTTVSSFLVNTLASRKSGTVLAVDADPNATLADTLGVESGQSIVEMMDEVAAGIRDLPAGMTKERLLEYKVDESLAESTGFDLISMGRAEGPGCYCYPNSLLRDIISKLSSRYDYVIMDNEAGMEHLSRRTTRKADVLIIVSDSSVIGARSAKRIWNIVRDLKISCGKVFLVVNKAGLFSRQLEKDFKGVPWDGVFYVPFDRKVEKMSANGEPLTKLSAGSKAGSALSKLVDEVVAGKTNKYVGAQA